MLYLALTVIFLHIISLPLVFDLSVEIDTDSGAGNIRLRLYFIPIFVKRINVDKIAEKFSVKRAESEKPQEADRKKDRKDKKGAFKSFLVDCAKAIVLRVRFRSVDIDGVIGSGDAATDAVSAGVFNIAYGQICALFGIEKTGGISPAYGVERILFDFFGIFSLCFADIIVAVCGVAFKRASRGAKRRYYANASE